MTVRDPARGRERSAPDRARGPRIGLFGLLGSGNIGNDASMESVLSFLRTDHPEAVVDAMFAKVKTESEKDKTTEGKMIGSPEKVTPAGFSNGIMKCQIAEIENTDTSSTGAGAAKTIKMPMCIWGDHSTVAVVSAFGIAELAAGNGGTVESTSSLAAKLRNDVRVKT